ALEAPGRQQDGAGPDLAGSAGAGDERPGDAAAAVHQEPPAGRARQDLPGRLDPPAPGLEEARQVDAVGGAEPHLALPALTDGDAVRADPLDGRREAVDQPAAELGIAAWHHPPHRLVVGRGP